MRHNKDRFLNATQAEHEFGKFCESQKSCKECGADSHGVSCRMWWMFMFDESDEQPRQEHVKVDPTKPRLRPRRERPALMPWEDAPQDQRDWEVSMVDGNPSLDDAARRVGDMWLARAQMLATGIQDNSAQIEIDWGELGVPGISQGGNNNEREEEHDQGHEEGYHV